MLEMPKASEPRPQRRSPRVTPDPLLIIRLPAGNQGVIFDLSPEGVGFLASAPVQDAATIDFEISGRTTPTSMAAGQLMWKDSSGKRGGLRFTHLPEELRALIASLLPGDQTPRAASTSGRQNLRQDEGILHREDPVLARPELEAIAPAVSGARSSAVANAVTAIVACLIVVAIWYSVNRSDARAAVSYLQRHFSAAFFQEVSRVPRGWSARTVAAPTTAPAVPAAAIREPLSAPPESNAALSEDSPKNTPQNQAPGTIRLDVPDSAASVASVPEAAAVTAARAPEKTMTDRPPQDAPGVAASQPSVRLAEDETRAKLAMARKLLQPKVAPADQAEAAGLLWQAVEKGNAVAEVELAGLYLTGRGVAKSCSQAVVLLTAARTRKNPVAEKSLAELSQYGCAAPGDEPATAPAEPVQPEQ